MSKLFPYPLLAAVLFVVWLAMVQTLAPAHVALAALLAFAIPHLVRPIYGTPTRIAAPGAAVRLALTVLWDIVVSNFVVARLVLGPIERLRPGFVTVPVALTHPYAVSLLASIITMTPGTVSAIVSESRREILVHALDLDDPDALVAGIKDRYERPLAEIFQ